MARTENSTNLHTRTLRIFLNDLLTKNIEVITNDFNSLEPKDRIEMFNKMMRYVLPRLNAVELREKEEATNPNFDNFTTEELKQYLELTKKINYSPISKPIIMFK